MKNYYYRRNTAYKTTLGTSFQVDLMKGLSLKLSGMWYLWMKETESFDKELPTAPGKLNSNRKASATYARKLDQTYNAILNYNVSFGDHNVSAVGGFEMIDKYNYGLSASVGELLPMILSDCSSLPRWTQTENPPVTCLPLTHRSASCPVS